MKLFLLCYATTATSATTVTSSSTIPQQDNGMSQLEKLSHLIVRPVCVTVRRAMAVTMQYESTQDAQKRISIVSWNKKPNQGGEKWTRAPTAIAHQMNNKSKVEHEDISQSIPTASTAAGPSSKKMKVRRDPNEVRIKGSSKYAKLWKNLKKPVTENESDS